ncbi:hypothetical protein [Arthrobacter sp.]|uniref:hypothetical protein n=1 Tax=Arthrobacter sp. TaxID=1667 RepID=UPI002810C78F|nr:hypothetical protein [Arthrobacter sp.]
MNKKAQTQLPADAVEGRGERPPGMVEVNVATAEEMDTALEEAIAVVTKTATHHRVGVLVTPTGAGSYIVRAHPAVPYGLIRQQQG